MRVLVIGAGLAGLSAACHLAGRGHEVVVLERESVPGGRAGLWDVNGYALDTGPTVMTMKGILAATFAGAGTDIGDHLELLPVDPIYRATFPDGSAISCRHGIDAMQNEIAEVCGKADAEGFVRFAKWLGELYRLEHRNFIDRNFDSPFDLAWPPGPLVSLLRLGGLRKLSSKVDHFFADSRLRRLFSFQAMYAGLSPFDALAIYGVITYMDSIEGVFFPRGGMHAIPRELANAAVKAGASISYSTSVTELIRRGGRVTGVRTASGERLEADAVVATPDLPVVYREMLSGIDSPRVVKHGSYSPSCLLRLAGVGGSLPPNTAHHNLHFGGQWKESFDALFHYGRPMPDPSILVTSPTISDPTLAPANQHILYALEPVPNLDGKIDWPDEAERLRHRLAERMTSFGYSSEIEVERWFDPRDWQSIGMERGTPFALSHKFLQTGPFRPNNVDSRVPGLVFAGSGTVPGVGVPMVLISGRLAADRVEALQ